jgi:hypothetical protein
LINTRYRAATAIRCNRCSGPLPQPAGRPVDAMLATGCSLLYCCQLPAHRGGRDVTVIGL